MLKKIIQKFEIRCIAKNLADSTMRNYTATFNRFNDFVVSRGIATVEDIDDDVIRLYLKERLQKVKKVTVKSDFVALRTLFCYMVKIKAISDTPFEFLDKPKTPYRETRCFSNKEVNQLLNYFDKNTFFGLRNHTIMVMLFGTGMRISELCNVRLEDINFDNESINVIGKGDKQRHVPLNDVLKGAIVKYGRSRQNFLNDRTRKSAYLFVSRTGRKLNRANIEDIFLKMKRDLGITEERFCAHTWRHTFAVNYLRNGGDVYSLMRILGHTNLETTKHYIHLSNNDIHTQNARFNPLTNSKWLYWGD